MKYFKLKYLIIIVGIVAYFVLFSFPEPETNFLEYLITALLFLTLIILLVKLKNK